MKLKLKNIHILLFGAGIAVFSAVVWLGVLAWQHKGFFVYHYDIATSPEHAAYQEELLTLVRQDPAVAFARYRAILEAEPISHNTCHGIAHQMGHEAFESLGFQRAMKAQDALCGAGYIHGIIEAKFGLLQEKDILAEVTTLCDATNYPCHHGVGHGLMVATHLDIARSLSYCDLLPDVANRNCYDGVWMHIFDLEESGARDASNSAVSPDSATIAADAALCAGAAEQYKTSCYFYLPRIFAHYDQVPFASYSDLCEASVEEDYRATCAAGSGHSVMKYAIANPEIAMDACESYSDDMLIAACKEGASIYYLFAKEDATCDRFGDTGDRAICTKVDGYRDQL